MISLPPEQLFSQRFIDYLASSPRRDKPEQFLSDLLIDRHIEFDHDILPQQVVKSARLYYAPNLYAK
jgi:hypothetical protein